MLNKTIFKNMFTISFCNKKLDWKTREMRIYRSTLSVIYENSEFLSRVLVYLI